ncbi:RICIN domain-containing protein, partial [Micromonospora zamorensis]
MRTPSPGGPGKVPELIPKRHRARRLTALAGALVGVLVGIGATPGAPSPTAEAAAAAPLAAAIEPGQSTPIIGTASGRCLEVPNSSTTNGTQTQLWDCNGAAGQTWTWTAAR